MQHLTLSMDSILVSIILHYFDTSAVYKFNYTYFLYPNVDNL